jgi:hypothetical protein
MLIKDDDAPGLLMDLYDSDVQDKWRNVLISRAVDSLKNVYITMLAATNETNLSLSWPRTATEGGLLARTNIVFEERQKIINSLVFRPKKIPVIKSLSKKLFEVASLNGEFVYDNLAAKFFDKWYNSFMTLESIDKTGTKKRLPVTALKVAMCISLSNKNDLVLLKEELEEAISRCTECIVGMRKVFLGSGEHSLIKPTSFVMRVLIKRPEHKISRPVLLSLLHGQADAVDLDRIIATLEERQFLSSYRESMDTPIIYKICDGAIEQFTHLVEEEGK